MVDDQAYAGQLLRGPGPSGRHRGEEVHRLHGELALDVAREAGVPLDLQGAQQVQLVAEMLGNARDVHREDSVPTIRRRGDHEAKSLAPVVKGLPGHGQLLTHVTAASPREEATYRWYVLTVCVRIQVRQTAARVIPNTSKWRIPVPTGFPRNACRSPQTSVTQAQPDVTYDICWRDGQGFSVEAGPQGAEGAQRAGGHAQGGVLRLHQARADRRGRGAYSPRRATPRPRSTRSSPGPG